MSRRVKDLEGSPRSAHMGVSEFMALLAADQARYPRYHGELYVELHRGVQTVQARIKKRNRQCESALRELEMLDVLGEGLGLPPLDAERMRGLWKVLLKNQFHDILPGTSIPEEHIESLRATGELLETAESMVRAQWQTAFQAGEGCTVLNTFSWENTADVEVEALPEGQTLGSEVNESQTFETVDGERKTVVEGLYRAPLSLSGFERVPRCVESPVPFDFEGDRLMTPFYEVKFADNGGLDSLIDRRSGRELRGAGAPLNTFTLGEDLPNMWDNWDIDDDQVLKMKPVGAPEAVERTVGPLQVRIRQTFRLGRSSTLWQDMVFHKNSARIDFETKVDWQETHSLLKTGFNVSVTAMNFKSDIQFGWVERPTHRNTPYDQAKFEVCQHKWSDLSEPGYGVALLNDCNYGISVYGSDLRLSLLKSGGHPDPRGDRGVHSFRYALFPHAGPFRAETVVREAYAFNHRARVFAGLLPEDLPPPVQVDAPNVVVETVKRAEDGRGWILRLFEAEGTACRCRLEFGGTLCRIEQTNMLEETEALLLEQGTQMDLPLRAFGIVTLRVV